MLLNTIYASDTPTNVFPSIHVYNSLAVHIALHRSEWFQKHKAFDIASLILCVSICMSTVLLKQHSITDVIGASILMAVMYTLVYATDYSRLLKKAATRKLKCSKFKNSHLNPTIGRWFQYRKNASTCYLTSAYFPVLKPLRRYVSSGCFFTLL